MKAIIIEDENKSRLSLENMIKKYFDDVEIIGSADNIDEGVLLIREFEVDFVLLDIEMPQQNGFKLFDYFPNPNFEVVFTTAYGEYALKALKLSAIDYLLKPIDLEELRTAISKIRDKKEINSIKDKLEVLKHNLNNLNSRLALPTKDGFSFIDAKDIIWCEAQSNYTLFVLSNGKKEMVSKTLKIYSAILEEFNFYRISRKHLINLNHVDKIGRQKSPTVTLSDGTVLSISLKKKNDFLSVLSSLK